MSTSSLTPESRSPLATALMTSGPESTINVTVQQDASGNYSIDYYPKRRGESTVYHTDPPHKPTLSRPRMVTWAVYGMSSGQRMDFKAKVPNQPPGLKIFPQDVYSVAYPDTEVSTGNALRSGGPGLTLPWFYSMELIDIASGNKLAGIDPIVIVMDDP